MKRRRFSCFSVFTAFSLTSSGGPSSGFTLNLDRMELGASCADFFLSHFFILNFMTIEVKLSLDRVAMAFLSRRSDAREQISCSFLAPSYRLSSVRAQVMVSWTTAFSICSTIPSQIRVRYSVCSVIFILVISGDAIKTPDFPPCLGIFASISPNARETASLPGNIRLGPKTRSFFKDPSSCSCSSTP